MGGNIPGENSLGGNFPAVGGEFPRESLMGGNFSVGNFHGGGLLEPFSSYDVSILIFQKIYQHYIKQILYLSTNIKRLSKRYILETHKISRKTSLPKLFCFNQREIFSTQNT